MSIRTRSAAILIAILTPILALSVSAQSVYLHPSHEAYEFLKRMETKEVITGYRDAVKPMTRVDIARWIEKVEHRADLLTGVEREELNFLKEEFYVELKQLHVAGSLPDERWHLYRYRSDSASFNVDLVGGYSTESLPTGKTNHVRSNGLMTYGYVSDFAGAYLYFRDNQDGGTYFNAAKPLLPDQGQVVSRASPQYVEYDLVDAQLNFDLSSAVRLSIEKMPNVWGAGFDGNLIFSTKPPSFPQINLSVKLGKDINFTYIHGWLFSGVVDSVNSYQSPVGDGQTMFRTVYRQKYIASHLLEMSVWDGVDVSIGESEVYGGRSPELLYLIPVMFFKAAEHYSSDEDNSQIFGSIDVNRIRNVNLYATIFIDEFNTDNFWNPDKQRNQLGFTTGTRFVDLYYPNTDLIVEYTRINPWVYNHKFPDATYQNHGYDMGDWIGQNADRLYLETSYMPSRDLTFGLEFESIRKGGKLPTIRQYENSLPTPPFLYGPLIKRQAFGLTTRYEPLRDMMLDFKALVSRYTQQAEVPNVFQFPRIGADYADKLDLFIALRYNFQ